MSAQVTREHMQLAIEAVRNPSHFIQLEELWLRGELAARSERKAYVREIVDELDRVAQAIADAEARGAKGRGNFIPSESGHTSRCEACGFTCIGSPQGPFKVKL